MTARRPDELTDALLRLTLPLADPPGGALPSADEVAALGEGLLSPADEAALVRRIDGSAAARAELRALYPERFKALFEASDPGPPAKVLRFPGRWRAGAAAATVAAAAAATLFLVPAGPPDGARLTVGASALERGAAPGDVSLVAPGQAVDVYARIGAPGALARLRGQQAWATVAVLGPDGQVLARCDSSDPTCRSADDTVALRWRAPTAPGAYRVAQLSGVGAAPPRPLPTDLAAWAQGRGRRLEVVTLQINP